MGFSVIWAIRIDVEDTTSSCRSGKLVWGDIQPK